MCTVSSWVSSKTPSFTLLLFVGEKLRDIVGGGVCCRVYVCIFVSFFFMLLSELVVLHVVVEWFVVVVVVHSVLHLQWCKHSDGHVLSNSNAVHKWKGLILLADL